MTTERTEQIARYVAEHPAFAPYTPRPGYPSGIWVHPVNQQTRSASELAEEMTEDVGFQALAVGGFLKSPDGELIAEGVRLALPTADREIFSLAVDALTLAAEKQTPASPRQVGAGILVGVLVLWLLASINRPT
jgi:hypothetical protein